MTDAWWRGAEGPVRFVRHGGMPVWGGWLFVGMGAAVLALRHHWAGAESTERLALALVGAVLATAGALVVIRGFSQTITIQPGTEQLVVEDRTRFRTKRRVIPFGEIREVTVESHTDPDPDSRPFERTTHRVIVRLRDGSEVPITDFTLDADATARIRSDVARRLE